MTGGSLGLRSSGSYGSLPQQVQQNGGSHSLHQSLYVARRPSKTSLTGYREKERVFTFRCLSRRKVGMVILVVIALLGFMTGFFTVSKEDVLDSPESAFDARYSKKSSIISSLLPIKDAMHFDSSKSMISEVVVCQENTSWNPSFLDDSVSANSSTNSTALTHPCKNFAFPPPPPGDRRRIGPRPCPVCYVDVERAKSLMPRLPSASPVLNHLTYISETNPSKSKTEPHGGSEFGGYPSHRDRNNSFNIKEAMTVHCGFVKGCRPGYQTGFDIDVADLSLLSQSYEVIVASAIFGNYDVIQQPRNVSETARNNVPFFMFVDEETQAFMKNNSLVDEDKRFGLWRIIVVHNVPYADPRRNGKVPKLLLHRLFPNSRFSIWIDGKLQLVVDPYRVLERFLWRQNATFAISRHYSRFDVFEEAEANKAAGKYDNVSIDYQIEFYKKEGLTPYTTAKLPITSDVPEGCVIIREHIPITNLFSCLWFNEVDRFTSRDQLSFSTVRDKVMSKVNWGTYMFQDCERRNFVIQAYHRDVLQQKARLARARNRLRPPPPPPSPPVILRDREKIVVIPKRNPVRHGKEKRPVPRRRRRAVPRIRENSFL